MTDILGVIGHPVNHSMSPVFQQAALDHLGINKIFEKWDVAPKNLEEKIESFRNDSFIASCVTLPHKQNVIPFIDDLTDSAKSIGAVNWIYKNNNKSCTKYIYIYIYIYTISQMSKAQAKPPKPSPTI